MAETRAEREANQQRAVRLGRGPALVQTAPGLDVALDLALRADGGDLALVEGLDALAQDLRVALTTGLGADPFDASFGFDGIPAMAEETDPVLGRERIRAAVVRTLQRDRRIARLRAVDLAEPTPDSRADRRLTVVATVQIDDASAATLRLTVQVGP